MGVDLDAVRTFVAAADAGQFQEAAADLSITASRCRYLDAGMGLLTVNLTSYP